MADLIFRKVRDGGEEGELAPSLTIEEPVSSPFALDVSLCRFWLRNQSYRKPSYGRRDDDEDEEKRRNRYGDDEEGSYGRKKYGGNDSDEDEEKKQSIVITTGVAMKTMSKASLPMLESGECVYEEVILLI